MTSQTNHGVHVSIHMVTFFCSEYFGYMALGLFAFGRIFYFGPFWSSQHLSWPRIHFSRNKIVHLWSCSMIGETEISVADDIFFGWISFLGARLVSIQYWNGCPSVLSWTSYLGTRHLKFVFFYARHRTIKIQRICFNISNNYSFTISNHYSSQFFGGDAGPYLHALLMVWAVHKKNY